METSFNELKQDFDKTIEKKYCSLIYGTIIVGVIILILILLFPKFIYWNFIALAFSMIVLYINFKNTCSM